MKLKKLKRPKTGDIYFVMAFHKGMPKEGIITIENAEAGTIENKDRVSSMELVKFFKDLDMWLDPDFREAYETRLKVKIGEL